MSARVIQVVSWLGLAGCGFQAPAVTPGDATVPGDAAPLDSPLPPGDGPAPDDDGDGVANATDVCPQVADPAQYDEDGDGRGDRCDNCPHVVNPTQVNLGETNAGQTADAVGDACDPQPALGGNQIALFLGFNTPADVAGWQAAGDGTFAVTAGQLVQSTSGPDLAIFWTNTAGARDGWVSTKVTYTAIDAAKQFRGATVMTRFERSTTFGTGGGCGEIRDSFFNGGAPFLSAMRFQSGGFSHLAGVGAATVTAGHTQLYTARGVGAQDYQCSVGNMNYTTALGTHTGNGINFAVWGVAVRFDYVILID